MEAARASTGDKGTIRSRSLGSPGPSVGRLLFAVRGDHLPIRRHFVTETLEQGEHAGIPPERSTSSSRLLRTAPASSPSVNSANWDRPSRTPPDKCLNRH
jgi:hypothetical protein